MFKSQVAGFLFLALVSTKAYAFDPVTIAMGIQAVSSIMGTLQKADEVADGGFAMGDLLEEIDEEPQEDDRLKKYVKNLEEVNSKVQDYKWSEENLRSAVQYDLGDAKSLSQKIRTVKRIIGSTKKIAQIMGYRPKAAESAARVQELRLSSKILEELQAMRRDQMLAYLEDKEYATRREVYLQELVATNRGSYKNLRVASARYSK